MRWARLGERHPLELVRLFLGALCLAGLCVGLTVAWLEASHGWPRLVAAAFPLAWFGMVALDLKRRPL